MCWSAGGWIGSGGNLRHLILLLDDLQGLGVDFVSLAEGIDATTPAGRLQLHILGAIAEGGSSTRPWLASYRDQDHSSSNVTADLQTGGGPGSCRSAGRT